MPNVDCQFVLYNDNDILSFADDTTVYLAGPNINELVQTVNRELNLLYKWLCANKLSLNIEKTKQILFSPTETYIHPHVMINETPINRIGSSYDEKKQ